MGVGEYSDFSFLTLEVFLPPAHNYTYRLDYFGLVPGWGFLAWLAWHQRPFLSPVFAWRQIPSSTTTPEPIAHVLAMGFSYTDILGFGRKYSFPSQFLVSCVILKTLRKHAYVETQFKWASTQRKTDVISFHWAELRVIRFVFCLSCITYSLLILLRVIFGKSLSLSYKAIPLRQTLTRKPNDLKSKKNFYTSSKELINHFILSFSSHCVLNLLNLWFSIKKSPNIWL